MINKDFKEKDMMLDAFQTPVQKMQVTTLSTCIQEVCRKEFSNLKTKKDDFQRAMVSTFGIRKSNLYL